MEDNNWEQKLFVVLFQLEKSVSNSTLVAYLNTAFIFRFSIFFIEMNKALKCLNNI